MKTLYNLIALIAITNLLIISGLIGYLIVSGKLNSESVAQIIAVLRGEKLVPQTATTSAPSTQPTQKKSEPLAKQTASMDTIEAQRAILEREKRIIQDRFIRLKDAELKLIQDREAFLAEKNKFYKEVELVRKANQDLGFQKALALYSKMPPKLAKEDFMKLDIDTVVRYLMNMSKLTAAKILKEFKTPQEQRRRQEILERIRTQQRIAELASRKD